MHSNGLRDFASGMGGIVTIHHIMKHAFKPISSTNGQYLGIVTIHHIMKHAFKLYTNAFWQKTGLSYNPPHNETCIQTQMPRSILILKRCYNPPHNETCIQTAQGSWRLVQTIMARYKSYNFIYKYIIFLPPRLCFLPD